MTPFPRQVLRLLIPLAIGLLVVVRAPLQADDLVFSRFGDYIESLRTQTGIPSVAVAVVGRSDVQWSAAFGVQDVERNIAARPDTPMHVDGLTESFTTALVLRCVEEGRLSLDSRIPQSKTDNPDTSPTLRQILTHTTAGGSYSYRPDLFAPLSGVIRSCTGDSFRETLANQMDRLAMIESVPGMDVIYLTPPAEGILTPAVERYSRVLGRMAQPYAVDSKLKATLTGYSSPSLTPTSGLVSTVRDLAQFDIGLRNGNIVKIDTLAAAWRPASGGPHGMGWFVQSYNGENLVWQFGAGDGSSSMILTLPSRSLTLVMVANSNGLAKGFNLAAGDATTSPFVRAFLGLFAKVTLQ